MINGYECVADCSTYGYLPEANMPSDIRILIANDPNKSHYSSEKLLNTTLDRSTFYALDEQSRRWARNTDALIIETPRIFTVSGCRDLWTYCFYEPFPEQKVRQLLKLNIQHHEATSARFSKFVL